MSRRRESYVEVDSVKDSSYYKEKLVKQIILTGIGFIGAFIIWGLLFESNGTTVGINDRIFMAIAFMTVPSGWLAITSITGGWIVTSIPGMIIILGIKMTFSVTVGWILFPITLTYNIIMLIRKGREECVLGEGEK